MEMEISTPSIGKITPDTTAANVPNRRTGISGLFREIRRERGTFLHSSPSLSRTTMLAVMTKCMLVLPNEAPPLIDLLRDALLTAELDF